MKDKLSEFYPPEIGRLWQEATFVFDANVLLDLYRFSEKVRSEFFQVLEKLGDRVWIPHQFALEYHRNRHDVIDSQARSYTVLAELLESDKESFKGHIARFSRHSLIDCKEIERLLEEGISKAKEHVEKCRSSHPDWHKNDVILEALTKLLNGRVGDRYDEKKLDQVSIIGRQRFEKKIPPGYQDRKKGENSLGDYIAWSQILEWATKSKKPFILVTDEQKEDWWWIREGKKLGPRTELVREVRETAGVNFHLYGFLPFIEFASKSDFKISPDTIEEVKVASERLEDPVNCYLTGGQLVIGSAEMPDTISSATLEVSPDGLTQGLVGPSTSTDQ